jgi:hypothetical protein
MFRRQGLRVQGLRVREDFMFRPVLLASALLALSLDPALAQQPTQAQRDAIRASCRSDFMANCSSVTPGGKEALECLLRNQAKLSPACNAAVSAVVPAQQTPAAAPAAEAPAIPAPAAAEQAAPKPAPASAAEPAPKSAETQETQLKAMRQSCTLNDFMTHCSWIKPDNPELLLCLQSNAADLSPACQAAVQGSPPPAAQAPAAAPEKKPAAAAPSKKSTAVREPAPAAAPAAASAAPAAPPTEAQKSAIRAACRSDFMANCAGVQPGGAAALQCLKSNAAKLSGACQGALAAIGGGGGAPAAPSASPAAPVPAVAPLGPIPPMRPREALAILAVCRAEQQSLCGGIPIGGGRILSCLADHAPQLSLECYQALARAVR